MKVLLTGSLGFLGRHVLDALREQGVSTRILLHRHTVSRREFATWKGVEVVWGRFDEADAVERAVRGIDCVTHSGWAFSHAGEARPTVNERGTQQLFNACLTAGVKKFIFVSSVAVYGMRRFGTDQLTEQSPFASREEASFIYPAEKIAVEEWLRSQASGRMTLCVFRPGPIFDDQKGPAKKVMRLGPWHLGLNFGTGRNAMAFIHADDVADAVLRGALREEGAGVFNIVPTRALAFRRWIRVWGLRRGLQLHPFFVRGWVLRLAGWGVSRLKQLLGKTGGSDVDYIIAAATRDLRYSNERLKRELGWSDRRTEEYTRLC